MPDFVSRTRFDLHMAALLLAYLVVFAGAFLALGGTPETAIIRGFGSLAFLMLSFTLAIGPLSRFSPLFKRLVYNRRHLGVTTFFVGLVHAALSLIQFYEGDLLGVFTTNGAYDSALQFPFVPFGLLALLILGLMAATSHDFWFHKLGVARWKSLHMLVYVAYAALVVHAAFGFLQDQANPVLWIAFAAVVLFVLGVHLMSAARERATDRAVGERDEDGFLYACRLGEIPEGAAKPVSLGEERVAVIHHQGAAYALTNVCPHQNGPLGEGRVCDGYLECPWHGYQFSPVDGKGPGAYGDAVPCYETRQKGDEVWVRPEPFLHDERFGAEPTAGETSA